MGDAKTLKASANCIRFARLIICGSFSSLLLTAMPVAGQAVPQSQEIQEVWQGVVVNSDVFGSYSLSVFGLAELPSPRLFRGSEFFAGPRISRPIAKAFRLGIECLQDRKYRSDSSLILENRCAVDVARKWDLSPRAKFYLRPKLELRSLGGTFDQRLIIRGELLRDVRALRATFRGFTEPVIDHQFGGFEKLIVHAGMVWPMGRKIRVEVFDQLNLAKKPDSVVEAIGTVIFVQLRNKDKAGGEINR
jgi:hypothetical protein